MKNIEMKVEGEILTVRIDLAKDFGGEQNRQDPDHRLHRGEQACG